VAHELSWFSTDHVGVLLPKIKKIPKIPTDGWLSQHQLGFLFQLDNNNRTRGHSAKIKKNRCRTDLRKHFFSERVVNRWNSLKEHNIQANDIISFKRHLEKKEHKDGPFHGLIRWSLANMI